MEFFNKYFLDILKTKYTAFSGRARRKEFWMFYLVYAIISVVISILTAVLGSIAGFLGTIMSIISLLFTLGTLVPFIALWFRRMQDVDKPGWFFIIPLYNLYLAIQEGTKGDNQFGPDPKAGENA